MNIVYLNHYAGTPALGMEYRPYYLAREWVRLGHQVTMIAAGHSHVRTRQPDLAGADERTESIDGIHYHWIATPTYRGNGWGRLRNIAAFLRGVWRRTAGIVAGVKPDVVIASSTYPMDIWVARRMARLAGAMLVFEVHDLWPLSPIELSGMSPRHPFALLCSWAERDAYRDADVVVSMLPKVHQHMASRGLALHKLVIVPNGISPDDWQGEPEPLREDVAAALRHARAQWHTVVGYAGSMGEPNALDTLLDAMRMLEGDPISLVMVGDGHLRAHLASRMAAEGLHRITLLPPIPKSQIPSFLAAIDVAYIGWQRVPIYRFGIAPNKLMDYMMAARVVLHSVEAGNDPVAEAGCGITCVPADAAVVAASLRELATLAPAQLEAMGERGRAFVLREHTYPALARRFVDAMMGARANSVSPPP